MEFEAQGHGRKVVDLKQANWVVKQIVHPECFSHEAQDEVKFGRQKDVLKIFEVKFI